MKIAIRPYAKTGKHKKMAEALSEAVGVEALTVDILLTEDVDILFLGSAVYATSADGKVKKFLEKHLMSMLEKSLTSAVPH